MAKRWLIIWDGMRYSYAFTHIVGMAGFEPAISWSQTKRTNRAMLHSEISGSLFWSGVYANSTSAQFKSCWVGRVRTYDRSAPDRLRYQTALHPVK